MKLAKKMLAVVVVLTMVAAFSAVAFAADATVNCSVGEYKDGKATVTFTLVGAVGLTSGELKLAYDSGKITKILDMDGADKEAAGKCGNAFTSEINTGENPISYGFYFKNEMYDADGWAEAAEDYEYEGSVNASSFEFLKLKLTAEEGTVVTVTGDLVIGDKETGVHVPVSTSFTIGGGSKEEDTTKKDETTTKKDETTTKKDETTTKKDEVTTKKDEVTTKKDEVTTKKDEITTKKDETTTKKDEVTTKKDETTTKKDDGKADETTTAKTSPSKTQPGKKTDGGKKTGDNSVLAVMAGVIALAGAAFVVTKKRK